MPLLDTKLAIADALCKTGQLARMDKMYKNNRKKGPTKQIKTNGFDNLPYSKETDRSRCKTLVAQERVI
nr:unnamed protein product [Callosobruchus analis]